MSLDDPPHTNGDDGTDDDQQHKAWETRAAIAHLLSLCEALEGVDRLAAAGERVGLASSAHSARRPSVKGKEREVVEPQAGGGSTLQALHDHLSYLVTMYRRGLLKASDPPVRLPVAQPPALLQTTGAPNVFRFGRRVADSIVESSWLKQAVTDVNEDGEEGALVKSIAIHARYLLVLTSQDKDLQTAIKHLQAILAITAVTHPEAMEIARSSRRRLTSLQNRLARGPNAPPAQPSMPSSRFLDPKTANARALGKAPAGNMPFPRRLTPTSPTTSLSTAHTFADVDRSQPAASSAAATLPSTSARPRHSSAPPEGSNGFSSSSSSHGAGSSSFANGSSGGGGFASGIRRTTSTFSNLTISSITSLSPSLFSLRLSDERSEHAPALVDDRYAQGHVASPRKSAAGGGAWGWFGRRSAAEGTLRTLAANGRVVAPHPSASSLSSTAGSPAASTVPRLPIPRATKSTTREPVPSKTSKARLRVIDSVPPSPVALTRPSSPPSSGNLSSGAQTPSSKPTFKTQASDYGDKTLDPQLRQLEMASKVTKMGMCSVCGTEGVNLPECPRCRLLFCSRACRIGEDAAGDGKKHICGLLEKRRESVAAVA